MKIFMQTDMEGVAGVVSFENQSYPTGKYYEDGKRLVTAEINAAVDGLLDAGVEDVLVNDGHGAGAIAFDELHPAARLLHGRPLPPWPVLNEIYGQFDACVVIGQHAMAGIPTGNQNHTQDSQSIDYYKLNGQKIGEIAQGALHFGALGVPLIYLSGDEDACQEAAELIPGIVTTAVKKGLGRGAAISFSAQEARRRIREGIRQAVARHRENPIPPLTWDPPYEMEIRYFHTHAADWAQSAGAERLDAQTVRWRSNHIHDVIYK